MSFKIELDHIGIATPQIKESNFFSLLGLPHLGVEEVSSEKVKVSFYETQNKARVELLEPTDSDSAVAKFMDKRGPGIHHICFRVTGLDAMVEHLKNSGVQLINETPRVGAHNCRVVFVHPKSTGGVLVELSEKAQS